MTNASERVAVAVTNFDSGTKNFAQKWHEVSKLGASKVDDSGFESLIADNGAANKSRVELTIVN